MVRIETIFNNDTQKDVSKHEFKNTLKALLLASLIFLGLGIYLIVTKTYGYGVFLIILSIIFNPLTIKLISSKSYNKNNPTLNQGTSVIIEFYDDYYFVKGILSDDYETTTKSSYKYIYKLNEDENYFYIYVSSSQVIVAPKADIVEGSVEELKNIFELNLPKEKYLKK